MVKKKKLQFIKKKNSNFYSIMLRVMSRYKCNRDAFTMIIYLINDFTKVHFLSPPCKNMNL